jgi:hypothetical protein
VTATVVAPPRPAVATAPSTARVPWWRRPIVAAAVLLAVYGALSLANDRRGFLGTDTGGKVATLRAMDARGDARPDVGYWAQASDHDGLLHPLAFTARVGPEWVNVTTLPMLYAGYPLYELGGLRAVLLLPMLGGVLTALAARALARRLGGRGDLAFWLVGLATPVAVYALDFWEHTLGLALVAWGIVLALDVVDARAGWRGGLASGALFGAAATMRTEALVYAVVTVVVLAWSARARRPPWWRAAGVAFGVGVALPLAANQLLEQAILGQGLRAARTSGAASGGGTGVGTRLREALTTTVGVNRYHVPLDWLLGAVLVLAVAVGVRRLVATERATPAVGWSLLGLGALGYAAWIADGLGFLPGLLVASPLAVVGLVAAARVPWAGRPVAIALLALPLVWAFQYGGGANPQWGGRYELCSGLLLAVVGAVALEKLPWRRVVAVAAVCAAVTGAGLAWLSVRSHAVASAVSTIAATRGPIVATGPGLLHLWREGGGFYAPTRPWLTAERASELGPAARVLAGRGAPGFALVSQEPAAPPARIGPYRRAGGRTVPFLAGLRLRVTAYARGP